jgi:ferritin
MNRNIENAFNEQIKNEIYSAYIYMAMSAYFANTGWDGMSNWMKIQAQEEMTHAMKFWEHIVDRGGRVELMAIDKPPLEWSSPLDAFQTAYKHEQFISGTIRNLAKLATAEGDYESRPMLDWFLNEQIEEEAHSSKICQQIERLGGAPGGMAMLDRELGTRVFTPPAKEE